MKYLSLFSGIGGFEKAIQDIFPNAECVGFSEVDKYAIQVYQKHFPNHKNFGDITQIDIEALPDFDLLVGGSPCQDLSIAKKDRKGLDGERSGLFFNFVEILQKKKPKYFILENVASMSRENKDKISEIMGVQPVMINAALVSAQNRRRFFWANFPITQPEDRGILLKDILEQGDTERLKSYDIDANYFKGGKMGGTHQSNKRNYTIRVGQLNKGGQGDRIYSPEGKSVGLSALGGGRGAKTGLYCISSSQKHATITEDKSSPLTQAMGTAGGHIPYISEKPERLNGSQDLLGKDYQIRKLTPTECARLQCFPDNYCEGISNSQQYKCYGNAVNVEVIKHIVSCLIENKKASHKLRLASLSVPIGR